MEVEFANAKLKRLSKDSDDDFGFPADVVRAYRKRILYINSIKDERDLYVMKSLHFEKLKGKRSHQRSIKINDQWRLVLEIKAGNPKNKVLVVGIEDYHK